MSVPVRALVVDDSASNAGLLLEELRRGGFEPDLHRVTTREELETALSSGTWDVVLSDIVVKSIEAFEALSLLKERDIDVPFLIVSETLGEETAIRAMKAGAQNCIPRASLARLCPILEREMREAQVRRERRQAQKALTESELRYRTLAESAPDAILTVDAVGTLLFANRAAETLFGYPVAALIGQPVTSLLPDYRPHRPRSAENGLPERFGSAGRHADGRTLPLELTYGELVRDGKRLTTVFARDLAERTRAEEALRNSEERFRRAALMSTDLVHECDRAANRMAWFGDVDRILGYASGEFPRTVEAWQKAIHPEDQARVLASVGRHWETGEPFFEEYRVLRRDGTVLHWNHCGTLVPGSEGQATVCIGTVTDVSGRRQIEEALRLSEKRYRTLFERNLAGVYRSTLEGRILDCNESFARIFGYASREEVLQQAAWDFYLKPEDRQAALAKLLERQSLTNYELCLKRKDGSHVWVLESENLIEGPDGRLSVIEGTTIDITERKRAEEQVKHLAFHDPLTNLPNRLLFNDRLTLAVAQAHRHNQRLAVLFLDLDRFKVINDSLGHSVGDELLRQVAERIQEYVREGDTVARLGGDEFTLLVPGISAEEDAAKIAKKVCDAIHDPFWIDGRELFVTTSLGVAVYPSDGHDAEIARPQRRLRDVPGQGAGPRQLPALHPGDERQGRRAPLAREPAAAGRRQRRARAPLPALHRPEHRRGARGRGPPALEASGARHDRPRGVHSDRRALGPDRPDRRMGPAHGLRRGAQVAREGIPEPHGLRQPLLPPVPAVRPRHPGRQRAGRDRARARQARPRDHRIQRDAERRALDQHALGPQEAGRADLDGRLRHRVLVARTTSSASRSTASSSTSPSCATCRETRTTPRSPWPSSRWAAASSSS